MSSRVPITTSAATRTLRALNVDLRLASAISAQELLYVRIVRDDHVFRRAVEDDPAFAQQVHALCDAESRADVVRHDDGRHFQLELQLPDVIVDGPSHAGVKSGGRIIA